MNNRRRLYKAMPPKVELKDIPTSESLMGLCALFQVCIVVMICIFFRFALWGSKVSAVMIFLCIFFDIIYTRHCLKEIKKIKNDQAAVQKENEQQQAAYDIFVKEHPCLKEEYFYVECYNAGIEKLETSQEIARALLWAKNANIITSQTGDDAENAVRKALEVGEHYAKKSDAMARAACAEQLRKTEKLEYQRLTKYLSYRDQEKPYQMYSDLAQEQRDEIDKITGKYTKDVTNIQKHYQKEGDWAISGGLASGIAGPAAGLASAINTESRNQEIRDHNNTVSQASYYATMAAALKMQSVQKKLDEYEAKARKAQNSLVERLPQDELLSKINPRVSSIKVTDSGAVVMRVKFSDVSIVKIYDSVNATVDGFLQAVLLKDGERAGTVIFTLPPEGVRGCPYDGIRGICIDTTDPDAEYEVRFEPYDLWAIEA